MKRIKDNEDATGPMTFCYKQRNPRKSIGASKTKPPLNNPSQKPTITAILYPSSKPILSSVLTLPTKLPTFEPTSSPSSSPTIQPSLLHTNKPSNIPTLFPTEILSQSPTLHPTSNPTSKVTMIPTYSLTYKPSSIPTKKPNSALIHDPNKNHSYHPSNNQISRPDSLPTIIPTDNYVPVKKFSSLRPYTKCKDEIDQNEDYILTDTLTICLMKCDEAVNCKSFFFNDENKQCFLLKKRIKKIIDDEHRLGPKTYCVKEIRSASTKPIPCSIEAHLDHLEMSESDNVVYGYHSDTLSVTKEGQVCDYYYYDLEWCTYSVTNDTYFNEEGDSALFWEIPNYSINVTTEETILIENIASKELKFRVDHLFSYTEETYYLDKEDWDAYLYPAQLSIINKTNKKAVIEDKSKRATWSHAVEKENHPYIMINGNWTENVDYNKGFYVTVKCSSKCYCDAEYSLLS